MRLVRIYMKRRLEKRQRDLIKVENDVKVNSVENLFVDVRKRQQKEANFGKSYIKRLYEIGLGCEL